LVSVDEQGLTLRRKDKGPDIIETIARADVASVSVKQPSAKKIVLLAVAGSAIGALAGGSRCKGPTDYTYTPYGGYSSCRNTNGYYFDKTGGAIGAGAGAALGLLGFAFPNKKILYKRPLLAKANDSDSRSSGADSDARKESSLQAQHGAAGDRGSKLDEAVPATSDCEIKLSERGDCHATQE